MAEKKKPESPPPPDLHAPGHERWALLWNGIMKLLHREERRAWRRVMVALEQHGLAGPEKMRFLDEPQTGVLLPYVERIAIIPVVLNGPLDDSSPPELVEAVLARARTFEANPYVGRLQGRKRKRRATPRELLLAYHGALWKVGPSRARMHDGQEARNARACRMVAAHYKLKEETVLSFLQDARRTVPAVTKRQIAQCDGEVAWRKTIGAKPPEGGLKK